MLGSNDKMPAAAIASQTAFRALESNDPAIRALSATI
jgi:hypothetical protein